MEYKIEVFYEEKIESAIILAWLLSRRYGGCRMTLEQSTGLERILGKEWGQTWEWDIDHAEKISHEILDLLAEKNFRWRDARPMIRRIIAAAASGEDNEMSFVILAIRSLWYGMGDDGIRIACAVLDSIVDHQWRWEDIVCHDDDDGAIEEK